MRKIDKIVVHHSAVDQPDLDKALKSFNKTHKVRFNRNKWYPWTEYIQYHFVIWEDWTVKKTCPIKEVLYHASDYRANQDSIAICLSWNFDKHPPTAKQYWALIKLIWEFDLPVYYHNQFANKTCPWLLFNKEFVNFMTDKQSVINLDVNSRDIKRQRINKYYEYKQTPSDCGRYNVMWLLSDVIGRELTDFEIDNFKRWSDMFTDVWTWTNTIIQLDILLKRWNFNHPEMTLRWFAASPRYDSKLVSKFLSRWYSAAYSRKTSRDFVKDKRDWVINNNIVDESWWHWTRARLDLKKKMVEEINNYKWSENNRFHYKDFLEFAKNWNIRDYLLFIYKPKK